MFINKMIYIYIYFCFQYAETIREYDEQMKQISSLKKKCHRLTTEAEDINLHLQDETSRNAQLEKKQRK